MTKTKLEELNLLDKFLFDEAMEDKETYQTVVSILLENEVELAGKPETEKELRVSPQLREVRLDVVGMDKEGKIEGHVLGIIETGNELGLPKENILEILQKKLHISLEKAEEYYNNLIEQK